MMDYSYIVEGDGWLFDRRQVLDDCAELQQAWPDLESEEDGIDIFEGVYPISGQPEQDEG